MMSGKKTIISCLLPAYVLLVLHAIIPHHHHYGADSDPVIFHHEFDFVEEYNVGHPNDHGDDCCSKAHHFAHAPEKAEAMMKSGVKRIAFPYAKKIPGYLIELPCLIIEIVNYNAQIEANGSWRHISTHTITAQGLRGPPESSLVG